MISVDIGGKSADELGQICFEHVKERMHYYGGVGEWRGLLQNLVTKPDDKRNNWFQQHCVCCNQLING
jgi:hypothetical protein